MKKRNLFVKRNTILKTIRSLVFSLFLFLPFLSETQAEIIHVPNGSSIQQGLDAASSGDTVIVAAGTYNEINLNFQGKSIHIKSQSGPAQTIIDGGGDGTVFLILSGETREAIIEGFTIKNGYSNTHAPNFAGGIYIKNASPTIIGNIIMENHADTGDGYGGGGIKVSTGSNPLIQGNTINNNSCYVKGGGIQIYEASAEIRDNKISSNVATGCWDDEKNEPCAAGGGIGATFTSSLLIKGNTIESNTATFSGGGMSVYAGNCEITGNEIINNDGGLFAGGIHVESHTNYGDFNFVITENVIQGNRSLDGGGIHSFMHETASYVEIRDNQIIGNEALSSECQSGGYCGRGGGLTLLSKSAGTDQHVIKKNIIQDNYSDSYGGALFVAMPIVFEENVVKDNHAVYNYPGTAFVDNPNCSILRNQFLGNFKESEDSANFNPGALYVKSCDNVDVVNNFFFDNKGYYAGAAYLRECLSRAKIINNTFSHNITTGSAYGTVRTDTSTDIINNIFLGDVSAIRIGGTPDVSIKYNNFYGQSEHLTVNPNHDTVESINQESFAQNNIGSEPLLNEQDSPDLLEVSPCVNNGTSVNAPDEDIYGNTRPYGTSPREEHGS